MKAQLSSQRIPVAGKASGTAVALAPAPRTTASRGPARNRVAYVHDLRIFAMIGREVVEVLWGRAVDDLAEILVRRINGTTFQQPIQLLNNVELLR